MKAFLTSKHWVDAICHLAYMALAVHWEPWR